MGAVQFAYPQQTPVLCDPFGGLVHHAQSLPPRAPRTPAPHQQGEACRHMSHNAIGLNMPASPAEAGIAQPEQHGNHAVLHNEPGSSDAGNASRAIGPESLVSEMSLQSLPSGLGSSTSGIHQHEHWLATPDFEAQSAVLGNFQIRERTRSPYAGTGLHGT